MSTHHHDGGMPFHPVEPSRATRKISLRGRFSFRGALVWKFRGSERIFTYESLLECTTLHVLLTDRHVVDIWDQAPPVTYFDELGESHTHTFDFLVTYACGKQIGYAVKPHDRAYRVEENGFRPFVDQMARVRRACGHEVRIVTEKSFSRVQDRDAELTFHYLRRPDNEADAAVLEAAHTLNGIYPLKTLRKISGVGPRFFGSVVRLIAAGKLAKRSVTRLDPDSKIETVRDRDV
ncbi:TnsA endonuclease N-terminal domain-containing protein [Pelagibacterium nitratireducens]|uniref:TnsA endonuclease N-terminal domain-containing protein n=1 Tax=Pelagibacterium nitratireducens TaxID=1046114 RepID=A0ABZ2I6H9_9HYPH